MGSLAAGASAGLGMLGGAIGGRAQAGGIKNAQRQSNKYSQKAIDELKASLGLSTGTMQPWANGGVNAFQQLQDMTANPATFDRTAFMNDPGFQFMLQQGNQAIDRGAAARGKFFAPETINSMQQFGQGLAQQEYGNAFNRFMSQNQNLYNQLFGLAGMGFGAAQNIAGQQGQTGANIANVLTGQGAANANAAQALGANRANMWGGIFNQLGSGIGMMGAGGAAKPQLPGALGGF